MTHVHSDYTLHHHLRQATKQPHHALDHHPLLAPLLRSDLTVAQYGNALAALHGIAQRAEEGILAFLDQHPLLFDYQARRKVWALNADLAALGREPMALTTPFPVPQSVAALIGVLYAIEGSTQGGLMIARLLQALPIAPLPTAYFRIYGDTSAQKWHDFLQFANHLHSREELDTATATAISAFDAIHGHMQACLSQLAAHSPACESA